MFDITVLEIYRRLLTEFYLVHTVISQTLKINVIFS